MVLIINTGRRGVWRRAGSSLNHDRPRGRRPPRATDPRVAPILSPKSLARLVVVLAGVAAIALIAPHLGYIPMWDGRAYAECAVEASLHNLAPFYLRCWGHASHLYLGLLAISQLFDHGNGTALIAVNAIILALGVAGFHRLTRVAFPDDAQRVDRALLSAVFMLQPPLLASVVQPGLDLPVLVGAVWTIALLIERRWAWTAVVGTAMMFSKETGVMLYGLFLGCWALWSVRGSRDNLQAQWEELRAAWPVAIPLVVFGAYIAFYKIFRPGQPAMWTAGIDTPLVKQFLVPRVDAYLGELSGAGLRAEFRLAALHLADRRCCRQCDCLHPAATGAQRRWRGRTCARVHHAPVHCHGLRAHAVRDVQQRAVPAAGHAALARRVLRGTRAPAAHGPAAPARSRCVFATARRVCRAHHRSGLATSLGNFSVRVAPDASHGEHNA